MTPIRHGPFQVAVRDPEEEGENAMAVAPEVFAHRDDDALVLAIELPASATRIWSALTDPGQIRAWWGDDVTLEARPGGRFVERWTPPGGPSVTTSGVVTRAEPGKILEFTWADEGWTATTTVTFEIEPLARGSRLRLEHRGWTALPAEERGELMEDHAAGWTKHLKSLAKHLQDEAA
jgi:uncharacterized protein YndB with AHSA1/START domain